MSTYIKKGEAWKIIEPLDRFLLDLYPEKEDAHEAACNLMKLNTAPTLWNLVHTCAILFQCYTESNLKNLVKFMRIFGFGERSYWLMPESAYGQGNEVWLMLEVRFGKGNRGYYLALRLKAGKDVETFTLEDVLVLYFYAVGGEVGLPLLGVRRLSGTEQEVGYFYKYEYDEEQLLLRFELVSDQGDPFGIPEALQMIDLGHPEGKDEKVWARIMGKWDALQSEGIIQQVAGAISGRVDQTDTYHIEDVVLSRTMLSILVEHQGEMRTYRIPVEKYKFLAEINPSQTVLITTHLSDGKLYADWPELGYSIRLSEFTDG